MNKKCLCGKTIIKIKPSRFKRTKYCSKICLYKYRKRPSGLTYNILIENKGWFKNGRTSPTKGKMMKSLEMYSKGYDAIHDWVERHFGKPKKCEFCKTESSRIYQWANKSGKYMRVLNDWLRLCPKCHQRYDYENFGARKAFYE